MKEVTMNISKENIQTSAAGSNGPNFNKPQTAPGSKPVAPEVIGDVMPKDATKKRTDPMQPGDEVKAPPDAGRGDDKVMGQPEKSS